MSSIRPQTFCGQITLTAYVFNFIASEKQKNQQLDWSLPIKRVILVKFFMQKLFLQPMCSTSLK